VKKLLVLIAVLLAAPALAQDKRDVTYEVDYDSATETFCLLDTTQATTSAPVQTSGSSTTLTAVSGSPFSEVAVNDKLIISQGGTSYTRVVSARASATSITLDVAVNVTSASLKYQKLRCGTTTADGWFAMSRRAGTIDINVGQLNVTGGLDVRVQCAATGGQPRQVYPALTPPTSTASYINFTAVGGMAVGIPDPWDKCRVGIKIGSADDGGDLTTNQERVTIKLELR